MEFKAHVISFISCFIAINCFAQEFKEHKAFVLHEQSQLKHDTIHYKTYRIEDGQNLVFEFISDNGGDPGNRSLADSRVTFYIPSGITNFEFKDEDLLEAGALYIQRCHCQDKGIHMLNKGVINGAKHYDGSWSVSLDVTFLGRNTDKVYHIVESGTYKRIE